MKKEIPVSLSLYNILNEENNLKIKKIRNQILLQDYPSNVIQWFEYYPASQIIFIDFTNLVKDPMSVLNYLQHQLGLPMLVNHKDTIKYDYESDSFCPFINGTDNFD